MLAAFRSQSRSIRRVEAHAYVARARCEPPPRVSFVMDRLERFPAGFRIKDTKRNKCRSLTSQRQVIQPRHCGKDNGRIKDTLCSTSICFVLNKRAFSEKAAVGRVWRGKATAPSCGEIPECLAVLRRVLFIGKLCSPQGVSRFYAEGSAEKFH